MHACVCGGVLVTLRLRVCVCVCLCVSACACTCVGACAWARVRMCLCASWACACVCARERSHQLLHRLAVGRTRKRAAAPQTVINNSRRRKNRDQKTLKPGKFDENTVNHSVWERFWPKKRARESQSIINDKIFIEINNFRGTGTLKS